MKLIITSQGQDLDSPVDPRFGRAKYFLLVDSETMEFSVHDNVQNLNAPQGAGIQAAQNAAKLGAAAVLTGNVGPKAFTTLQAANIAVYTGAVGAVNATIEQYKNGQLKLAAKANVEGHWA